MFFIREIIRGKQYFWEYRSLLETVCCIEKSMPASRTLTWGVPLLRLLEDHLKNYSIYALGIIYRIIKAKKCWDFFVCFLHRNWLKSARWCYRHTKSNYTKAWMFHSHIHLFYVISGYFACWNFETFTATCICLLFIFFSQVQRRLSRSPLWSISAENWLHLIGSK